MNFVINGMFYTQKITGVHRFAREIVNELDKIIYKNEIIIVVPEYASDLPSLHNVKFIKYGKTKGLLWEQIDLAKFLKKNEYVSINLCNSQPLLCPGVICIHDAAYKAHPEFFKTLHGKLSVIWHRVNFLLAKYTKYPIITVSHFSKYQLIDAYKLNPKKIYIIGNAWQHIDKIDTDKGVLERHNLKEKNFFFTLGNINYNKNTKWIIDYARKNPSDIFVLSGKRVKNSSVDLDNISNVKWLGYLSDAEIKALYQTCKAFIFPSIHEGFGIPPMEALSQGSRIVISNATSLPEIYKNCAYYIDPYDTDVNICNLLEHKLDDSSVILENYSWEKSAKEFKKLIIDLQLMFNS
jgi:glycosyltransferase involved in cell wall biosynthesis